MSAAINVLSQLASPTARGLFTKAIIESGAYDLVQPSLALAEASGEAFATKTGCSSQTAACLRGLSVQTILNNQGAAGPNIDGKVLTQSIGPALASGQFSRVPVINGSNHDEWRLFVAITELSGVTVTAGNYKSMIETTSRHVTPAEADVVAYRDYPLSSFANPAEALGAVGTDAIFACPALTVDTSVSKFVPTFGYEFNDENAPQRFLPPVSGFSYGAARYASEIQYLFDLNVSAFPGPLTAAQQRLAASMKQYWTNFARRSFPSSFGEPPWPGFRNSSQRIQSLDEPRPTVETDFAAEHQCAFWATARG